jgi:mannose/fructose-specific phosphotransferase system component IIA
MSDELRGVVVSHAKLAAALVDAVREITGQDEALVAVSNEGCSRTLLSGRLEEAVRATPSVVFVDLPGGSCLQAAVGYLRGHPGVAVVAGVNLAMLVDFVYHRDVSPQAAARRAAEVGGRAVKVES